MTTLNFTLWAIALLVVSALLVGCLRRADRAVLGIGTAVCVFACLLGASAALSALIDGHPDSYQLPWFLPIGEFHVGIDGLSAFFLLCIFLVGGLSAVYGAGYLASYIGKKNLAGVQAFFNLLIAAMAGLVVARDAVLFLMFWEVMTIASFFLVTFENEREDVRRAGMTYLIASQLGVVFLFILFALLSKESGGFDFSVFAQGAGALPTAMANACFVLAMIGFGAKAGFWPVHIWLPEAHPAAPSHVSALMSGVMIKMGIYGLLRTLTFLGEPPPWWGLTLIAVGAVSGIAGVMHALAQHDLKRLFAYSSIENIGIIALGIGIGLLGQSHQRPEIAFLGYAGALLHVLNHGLFKGLLFHAAGSVLHATGVRNIEALGGLLRPMPVTGLMFFIGAIAICGLPPFNGFVSEWLIYVGAFHGASDLPMRWAVSALVVIPALALIGGLAAACFVKAFGVVFLGAGRSPVVERAREANPLMLGPMIVGAGLCVLIGVWPNGALRLLGGVAATAVGYQTVPVHLAGPLSSISLAALVLFVIVGALVFLRHRLLKGRGVTTAPTWGCGYSAPTVRMQYSAGSFAQPLLQPFAVLMNVDVHQHGPEGYFPATGRYDEHLGDSAEERFFIPATLRFIRALSHLRVIQQGRIQLYLAYIFATLVVLLAWQLGMTGS
jgi:hydrogenase-4 component B